MEHIVSLLVTGRPHMLETGRAARPRRGHHRRRELLTKRMNGSGLLLSPIERYGRQDVYREPPFEVVVSDQPWRRHHDVPVDVSHPKVEDDVKRKAYVGHIVHDDPRPSWLSIEAEPEGDNDHAQGDEHHRKAEP